MLRLPHCHWIFIKCNDTPPLHCGLRATRTENNLYNKLDKLHVSCSEGSVKAIFRLCLTKFCVVPSSDRGLQLLLATDTSVWSVRKWLRCCAGRRGVVSRRFCILGCSPAVHDHDLRPAAHHGPDLGLLLEQTFPRN